MKGFVVDVFMVCFIIMYKPIGDMSVDNEVILLLFLYIYRLVLHEIDRFHPPLEFSS